MTIKKPSLLILGFLLFPLLQLRADTLSSCQTITASGVYTLANDISQASADACIVIRASNVTLDGDGKTITTSGGYAVDLSDVSTPAANYSNVIIKNFTSNDGVRTFGDGVNNVTIDNLHVSSIDILGSDDVVVSNNTVGEGGIHVDNADRADWFPFRPVVKNNVVQGGSTNVKVLFEIAGGKNHPCPKIDALADHNTIIDTRNDPPPEATAAVRVRCATHTTFTNNFVQSTGTALGLYLRDESDDGTYTDNVFRSATSQPALHIAAGNVDKTFPSRNTFARNVFRSDLVHATYLLGLGTDNHFTNNLIWSNGEDFLGYYGGDFGNTWDHNTFYAQGSSTRNLTLGGGNAEGPPSESFTNNIFSYAGDQVFGYDGFRRSRWTGDYNLFHNRNGSVSFGSFGSSLATWVSGGGTDAHSIEADPLFANADGGDFSLQSSSPAKGAASDGGDIGAKGFPDPNGSSPAVSADDGGCVSSGSSLMLFTLFSLFVMTRLRNRFNV